MVAVAVAVAVVGDGADGLSAVATFLVTAARTQTEVRRATTYQA